MLGILAAVPPPHLHPHVVSTASNTDSWIFTVIVAVILVGGLYLRRNGRRDAQDAEARKIARTAKKKGYKQNFNDDNIY